MHYKIKKNNIDCLIFVSAEDNKYNVLGGIGTYLGLLIRETNKLFPEIDIHWITKSPNNKEFEEINNGAKTYYLSEVPDYRYKPFYNFIKNCQPNEAIKSYIFSEKVSDQVKKILSLYKNKNIVIESGEWEGLGYDIYKYHNLKNILKVVRLHTPLATVSFVSFSPIVLY